MVCLFIHSNRNLPTYLTNDSGRPNLFNTLAMAQDGTTQMTIQLNMLGTSRTCKSGNKLYKINKMYQKRQ